VTTELWTGAERLVPEQVGRAAGFEWRLAWQRRRVRLQLFVALLPVIVAIAGVALQRAGIVVVRGGDVLTQVVGTVFLQLLVVVLPLIAGTGLVAQEAEARTLVYLLVRPLSRGSLLVGKFLGAWAALCVLLVGSLLATSAVLLGGDALGDSSAWLQRLPAVGAALVVGALAYGALFTLVGLLFSRPALVGLFLAFAWESGIPFMPGWIKWLTVRYALTALVPAGALPPGMHAAIAPPDPPAALLWLVGGAAVSLGLSVWLFGRRDYP
jgi:ABC-2 type transport system permease protein